MKSNLMGNEKKVEKVLRLAESIGLKNKVSIIKDSTPFAFCLGIKDPHVYISTKTISMMTEKQLKAIILHEKYHLEHFDSLTLLIGSLPQLLFPFFPLLPKLLENYKIERETKADRKAVRELGTAKPIIGALKKLLDNPSISPAFISSIAEKDTLEIRIKSLVNKKTNSKKIRKVDFLISLLSLSIILLSVTAPVHAIEGQKDKQDNIMVCLENNECAQWCKEHNSVTPYKPNMSLPYSSLK